MASLCYIGGTLSELCFSSDCGSRSLLDHLKIYSGKYIFNKNPF